MLQKITLILFCFLQFSCSGLFYHPDRYIHFPPKDFDFKPKEIKFKSSDGTQLMGWYFPSQLSTTPKATIIQFHGNAQNFSAHYLSLAWLTKQEFNLFTFSYRGYGNSEGRPDQKGTYLDGLAALNQGWELHKKSGAKKFIVYGQSLGGAISMRSLADFKHKDKIDLVVMDSTFASYRKVVSRLLSSHWLTWAFSPLSWLLVSDAYSTEEALKNNKIRLLVIHDEEDPVIDISNGEDIFALNQSKKEFWKLKQGRHVGIFASDNQKYRKKFVALIDTLNTVQ